MTVIEREQTDVITETERRARILEAAALEIEVRGWCRDQQEDGNGRVCAAGAVLYAQPGSSDSYQAVVGIWGEGMETGWEYNPATGALLQSLAAFNDLRAKDSSEVTFLLRWRAEEIRDGR